MWISIVWGVFGFRPRSLIFARLRWCFFGGTVLIAAVMTQGGTYQWCLTRCWLWCLLQLLIFWALPLARFFRIPPLPRFASAWWLRWQWLGLLEFQRILVSGGEQSQLQVGRHQFPPLILIFWGQFQQPGQLLFLPSRAHKRLILSTSWASH